MRLAHYLNQFFGGLGGENAADTPVLGRRGAVGPGIGLQHALGDRGEVVLTIVGGDTYVAEHEAEAALAIADCLREAQVDVLVAGPAFNAGRYGLACALPCLTAQRELALPSVTAMHPDNPAVEAHRPRLYVLPPPPTAPALRPPFARLP